MLKFFINMQNFFCVVCITLQDFLGKSDPYLEFAKQNSDGSFTPVHTTEVSDIMVKRSHLYACMGVCVCDTYRW